MGRDFGVLRQALELKDSAFEDKTGTFGEKEQDVSIHVVIHIPDGVECSRKATFRVNGDSGCGGNGNTGIG